MEVCRDLRVPLVPQPQQGRPEQGAQALVQCFNDCAPTSVPPSNGDSSVTPFLWRSGLRKIYFSAELLLNNKSILQLFKGIDYNLKDIFLFLTYMPVFVGQY